MVKGKYMNIVEVHYFDNYEYSHSMWQIWTHKNRENNFLRIENVYHKFWKKFRISR